MSKEPEKAVAGESGDVGKKGAVVDEGEVNMDAGFESRCCRCRHPAAD